MPKFIKKTLKEGRWEYKTIYYYFNNEKKICGPKYFKTDLLITKLEHNFYNVFLPDMPEYKVLMNLQTTSKGNTFFTAINSDDDRNYVGYPVKINKANKVIKLEGYDISSKAMIPDGTNVPCSSKILINWKSDK